MITTEKNVQETLSVKIYVYAYFSKYGRLEDQPSYSARLYQTTDANHILITTIDKEINFSVPANVRDFTPARLACYAAKISAVQLAAAEDIKEINDEMQKLLSIEHNPS